jgi:hypothetical protein
LPMLPLWKYALRSLRPALCAADARPTKNQKAEKKTLYSKKGNIRYIRNIPLKSNTCRPFCKNIGSF